MTYNINQSYDERNARASSMLVKTIQGLSMIENSDSRLTKIKEGMRDMLLRSYEEGDVWNNSVLDRILDNMYKEAA